MIQDPRTWYSPGSMYNKNGVQGIKWKYKYQNSHQLRSLLQFEVLLYKIVQLPSNLLKTNASMAICCQTPTQAEQNY